MNELSFLIDQRNKTKKLIDQVQIGNWVLTETGRQCNESYPKRQLFRVDGVVESHGHIKIYESGEIYTNFRVTEEFSTKPFFNSMGIVEIVPDGLVERYIKLYSMWESDEFILDESETLEI